MMQHTNDRHDTVYIYVQGVCEKVVISTPILKPIISTYKSVDKKKILKNSELLHFIINYY